MWITMGSPQQCALALWTGGTRIIWSDQFLLQIAECSRRAAEKMHKYVRVRVRCWQWVCTIWWWSSITMIYILAEQRSTSTQIVVSQFRIGSGSNRLNRFWFNHNYYDKNKNRKKNRSHVVNEVNLSTRHNTRRCGSVKSVKMHSHVRIWWSWCHGVWCANAMRVRRLVLVHRKRNE